MAGSAAKHESFSASIGTGLIQNQQPSNGMEKYFKMIMDKIENLETNQKTEY